MVHLADVHTLDISHTLINDAGLVHLTGVQTLDISHCANVTGSSFQHLHSLNRLKISNSSIAESNLNALNGLSFVNVSHCKLSASCIASLRRRCGRVIAIAEAVNEKLVKLS